MYILIELYGFLLACALACLIFASFSNRYSPLRKTFSILAIIFLVSECAFAAFWVFIGMALGGHGHFGPVEAVLSFATIICGIWSIYLISGSTKSDIHDESHRSSSTDKVRCLNCGADIDSKQETCQICGWTWK
jgi:hypothetical protein